MSAYIARRLLWGLVVLFLVSVIVFFSVRLLPGDPVLMFVAQSGGSGMTEEHLQELRVQHGLDKPVVVQFGKWIEGVVTGDLGKSITANSSVTSLLKNKLPITLVLGLVSVVISTIVGVLLGLIAAIRRGTWIDTLVTFLSYIGLVIPVFLLGFVLILVFGVKLKWLPVIGYTLPWDDFGQSIKAGIMPVICLASTPLAVTARQMRSSVLEINNMDYIRTAWSKGLRERIVVTRHILKNSLVPVITLLGISIGIIFGGSVIIEQMFAIPGMGRLLVQSVFNLDYVVIQGTTLIIAAMIIAVNLIVDISYGWFDPRIRYE
jgi:peptide/nickel transport system permease protein